MYDSTLAYTQQAQLHNSFQHTTSPHHLALPIFFISKIPNSRIPHKPHADSSTYSIPPIPSINTKRKENPSIHLSTLYTIYQESISEIITYLPPKSQKKKEQRSAPSRKLSILNGKKRARFKKPSTPRDLHPYNTRRASEQTNLHIRPTASQDHSLKIKKESIFSQHQHAPPMQHINADALS
jgi:phage protein D